MTAPDAQRSRLRRIVALVAGLNLAYFVVEVVVAATIGSVALYADSVDFLEDVAVNVLVFLALGWHPRTQARVGRVLAILICVPAAAAAWEALGRLVNPDVPDAAALSLTALGAMAVNAVCALILARVRHHGGAMTRAAFLAARNDVVANLAVIAAAGVTYVWPTGWPDLIVGLAIVALNLSSAREVWRLAGEQELAERALSGEDLDD